MARQVIVDDVRFAVALEPEEVSVCDLARFLDLCPSIRSYQLPEKWTLFSPLLPVT